jgi:hypothetical protein
MTLSHDCDLVTSLVHVEHGDRRLDSGDYPAMHSVEFAGAS